MAKIISVCNRKGGVGKTVTAVNLSAYLAALGKYVLLVDIDSQANATSGVGVIPDNLEKSIYHSLIEEVHPEEIIKKTRIIGYDILPSSFDLAGATVEMVNLEDREFNLLKLLDKVRVNYDYIIIDCPPSLELLTINGLVAAEEVIIPVQCEYYSLGGLNQLLHAIKLIQENLQGDLGISGALLTMYDKKSKLAKQIKKEVQRNFPGYVFKTIIPRDVRLAEAPAFGKTILQYDHKSDGAAAYFQLAKEIVKKYE
jgi:chromosome partitioning protein